ncbi:MAG: ABC transporter permease [Syntrophomonadaceae bacterium]
MQLLAIMRREFFYMWNDKGLRYILLLGPVLGFLLFYGIYSAQVLKNIPTAIVDKDNSPASREVISDLEGTDYLKIVAYVDDYEDLESMIQTGQVVVGVVIPPDYGRDLGNRNGSRLMAIIDGSNTIYATNANTAILGVSRTINSRAGIKNLMAGGLSIAQATDAFQRIDFYQDGWFNPTLNYAYFLVLAFALNVWQHCCMLASTMNITGETKFSSWLQVKASGYSLNRLFVGKSLTQIAVFIAMLMPVYILAFGVLKFTLACNIAVLFLFTIVFILAIHSLGSFISFIAPNAVDATRFGMIIAVPSFVISGYVWPLEAMPKLLQPVAWILPQTWFFQGFNFLVFKNPGSNFMMPYFGVLTGIALLFYLVTALLIYRKERC